MGTSPSLYHIEPPGGSRRGLLSASDLFILAGIGALVYLGVRLALDTPAVVKGPVISLAPGALPYYAARSLGRMLAAYALSLLFSLVYGRAAAQNPRAGAVLVPLLDVLQSVPILSFLPVILLSLSAILPQALAIELASIVLIFTSQAWNLTFSWYQSLSTLPKELREASTIFHFNRWLRFKTLELPFGALGLIWNSVMSWAGGWFFLMAAEIFTLGERDFRLPGLGAYLQEAAAQANWPALFAGIAVLVALVVALDQLVWRPLLAWGDRFKVQLVSSDLEPGSWFYALLRGSILLNNLNQEVIQPLIERIDQRLMRLFPVSFAPRRAAQPGSTREYLAAGLAGALILYGLSQAAAMLIQVSPAGWGQIGLGLFSTLLRVIAALVIALAWTVPLGVAIGTNPRLAVFLQPVVQVVAAVPATAFFPAFVLLLVQFPGGLNLAAVLLMLLGTQWYLLFNVIAGANAIPQDLKYTSTMLNLTGWQRWRTLILPALFPYVITGAITASGGAWNASIVAELVRFGGQTYSVSGIGSVIAQATANGNYPLLLAGTLSMILAVVLINRLVWRRLYQLAEDQYRME